MNKEIYVKMTLALKTEAHDRLVAFSESLDTSKTNFIQAIIMALTDDEAKRLLDSGNKVLAENRKNYLDNRRKVREQLSKLTPEQIAALLDKQDAS